MTRILVSSDKNVRISEEHSHGSTFGQVKRQFCDSVPKKPAAHTSLWRFVDTEHCSYGEAKAIQETYQSVDLLFHFKR